MTNIYKSEEGARAVRERYLAFLKRWPAPNRQFHVPTRYGETFVVASGSEAAPPLLLFHGAAANSAMWMGDVGTWAQRFRVYAIDMPGEAGLSAPVRLPLHSEDHALWLDDVTQALGISRPSLQSDRPQNGAWVAATHSTDACDYRGPQPALCALVGVSLGGWLALDYATRRPERVAGVAVMCPGGVGRQKIGAALATIPLRMCGRWGVRKARELVLGRAPANVPPAVQAFIDFVRLIQGTFAHAG